MLVTLQPISKRGKDRINQHGDIFELLEKGSNNGGQLNHILVESLNKTWCGEKWMGWFELEKEVRIIN